MKTQSIKVGLGILLIFSVCVIPAQAKDSRLNLIVDPNFQNGFIVCAPKKDAKNHAVIESCRTTPFANGKPVWELHQWDSKLSVPKNYRLTREGTALWSNGAKRIEIGPLTSDETRGVALEVNSKYEFDGQFPKVHKDWPSLLLDQAFPETVGGRSLDLASLRKLDFSADYELQYSGMDHKVAEGYDPRSHAAQYLVCLFIQSVPDKSYFYLSMTFYDDRYEYLKSAQALDSDGHKLIYDMDYKDFIDGRPEVNKWRHINADCARAARQAILYGYNHNLFTTRNPRDYILTGINLGWELPGLGTAGGRIRDLKLTADFSD